MNGWLFALLVALSIADAMTTVQIIKRGGRELNPAISRLMSAIGVEWALLVVKVAFLGVIAAVMYSWKIQPIALSFVLLLAIGIMVAVVFHNIAELQKGRSDG